MKFSTREDLDTPIERVFDMLCAFEDFERAAMRRGAEVRRTDTLTEPGVGASWDVLFMMRGKERDVTLQVVRFDRPNEIEVGLTSNGIAGAMTLELIALSPTRTRIIVGVELRPLTLPARLLVQSLKLTKATLAQKYRDRVAQYARDMEARYRAQA